MAAVKKAKPAAKKAAAKKPAAKKVVAKKSSGSFCSGTRTPGYNLAFSYARHQQAELKGLEAVDAAPGLLRRGADPQFAG